MPIRAAGPQYRATAEVVPTLQEDSTSRGIAAVVRAKEAEPMIRDSSPVAMAEFWSRQARTGPRYPEQQQLPWSPFEARLPSADGTPEQPLPTTTPEKE